MKALRRLAEPLLKPHQTIVDESNSDFGELTARCTPEKKTKPDKHIDTGITIEYFAVEGAEIQRVNWPEHYGMGRPSLHVYRSPDLKIILKIIASLKCIFLIVIFVSALMGGCLLGVDHPEQLFVGFPTRHERGLYAACRANPEVEHFSICRDGWESSSTGQGTCSWHGGVSYEDNRLRHRSVVECVSETMRYRKYR